MIASFLAGEMELCCASMSFYQNVILMSTAILFFNQIRTLYTRINLESLPGLGDLPFPCPSESYGYTAGYQSISVTTVVEEEEFCQVI